MFCFCKYGRPKMCIIHNPKYLRDSRPRLEMELSRTMRAKYGENAVEALVGALSSITTTDQLKALISGTKEAI